MTRREEIARVLYACEKRRDDHACDFMGVPSRMEPWDECKDTFLSDADAILSLPPQEPSELVQRLQSIDQSDDHDLYVNAGILTEAASALSLQEAEIARLTEFSQKLVDANEASIDRANEALKALAQLTDAFLSRHRCFPLDRATDTQKQWNEAMVKAYSLVGQPGTAARDRLVKGS